MVNDKQAINRILVVDDELGLREGCRRALTRHGYPVDVAATGQEGLAKIQEGEFALVLLDVMMPDISGIELLKAIQNHDPDIVCIIITGYATVELAVSAMKLGAYDFIAKPFSDDNLVLAVEKGLEHRRLELEARRLQQIEEEAWRLSQEKAMLEELDGVKSAFMRKVAHELRAPIAAIESQRPLGDFAVIAFSLSFEMDYLHVVQILRQAGVPLLAAERDRAWPLVIAGGPAVSANPLPVADFLDAVVIGEAEEVIGPLVETLRDTTSSPRDATWQALARISGV